MGHSRSAVIDCIYSYFVSCYGKLGFRLNQSKDCTFRISYCPSFPKVQPYDGLYVYKVTFFGSSIGILVISNFAIQIIYQGSNATMTQPKRHRISRTREQCETTSYSCPPPIRLSDDAKPSSLSFERSLLGNVRSSYGDIARRVGTTSPCSGSSARAEPTS